jgi:small basic protein (TIGR04137 family)
VGRVRANNAFSHASHSEAATEEEKWSRLALEPDGRNLSSPGLRAGRLQRLCQNPVENLGPRCNLPALNSQRNRSIFMSQHRSLKGASTITAKRNVLKRFERVELLKKRGQFKDGQKVLGLPKTKPDI